MLRSEAYSHSVDGEVSPCQVILDSSGIHLGECAWIRIGLSTRGYYIHSVGSQDDRCRAEGVVADHVPAQFSGHFTGESNGVPFQDKVQVVDREVHQNVPDRASNEVQGHSLVHSAAAQGIKHSGQTTANPVFHGVDERGNIRWVMRIGASLPFAI